MFLNYKEDWEDEKISTKNRAHEGLNDKYQYIYLYDPDTDEVRRIIHVEWSKANRPARYAVLTQLVNQKQGEQEDVVSYHIKDSLNECIRAAPH